jgi:acyl-homoserine lactone acylase PvdQ
MRNFVLGDDYGNISYLWVGRVPVRHGDINPLHKADSSAPVPGWSLLNEWTNGVWMLGDPDYQLPYYLNPRGGVVRSANDAPWYATECDHDPKRPGWIPFHVVPERVDSSARGLLMRELSCSRSIRSLDDVRAKLAFNTLSIESLHFIQALKRGWQMYAQDLGALKLSDDVKRLDRMLRDWNARADIDQPGMTAMFILRRNTSLPWFPENYTPTLNEMLIYLNELKITADNLRVFYKDIQVPWGDAHFMIINGRRIPLPGGTTNIQTPFMASMGSFPEPGEVQRDEVFGDNRAYDEKHKDLRGRVVCDFGSSFIHAHIMDSRNPVSYAITPQGQIDAVAFPNSPHIFQQAELFSTGQWMRIPLTRKEVALNLDPWGDDPGHEHPTRTSFSVDPAALFKQFTSSN